MFPWFLRPMWYSFRWRRHNFLEAVGYENASYSNGAESERNIETGPGREN